MVEKATLLLEQQEQVLSAACTDDEYKAALAISPQFESIHPSVLWTVTQIFASSRDGRVKKSGYMFLAHFLRLANIKQITLPHVETCDVAVITIPTIYLLCTDPKYGWPWCYDTTTKYLSLLVAAGIFSKPPQKRGQGVVYHFPLTAYTRPTHGMKKLEQLAKKRAKVSKSAAFKRISEQCSLQSTSLSLTEAKIVDSSLVDSSPKEVLIADEQEVLDSVQTIYKLLQQQQGIELLPATLLEIKRILSEHTIRVLRRKDGRLVTRSVVDSLSSSQLISQTEIDNQTEIQEGLVDSSVEESTGLPHSSRQSACDNHQNPLSDAEHDRSIVDESTIQPTNLLFDPKIVDSMPEGAKCRTEFSNISKDSITYTEETEFSVKGKKRRRKSVNESTKCPEKPQVVDSDRQGVSRNEFPALLELDREAIRSLAASLSHRYDRSDSGTGLYVSRLQEDPQSLHLAVIDALVRSEFPDPKHNPVQLGGGWITRQYERYHRGEEPPAEILAWARWAYAKQYAYDEIAALLAIIGQWQGGLLGKRKRVSPDDVIIGVHEIYGFWEHGGGCGLEEKGYLYVQLEDGTLLTCEEYHHVRLLALQERLAEPLCAETEPALQQELLDYLVWIQPYMCTPEQEAELIADIPEKLLFWVHKLESLLDSDRYAINIRVAPISCRRVIEVVDMHDTMQTWILPYVQDVQEFIRGHRCAVLHCEEEVSTASATEVGLGRL